VYRGHLPFARSGWITYRVGEPLSFKDQLKDYRIREGFKLFSRESQRRYREQFDAVTRVVMDCINRNVDERYRK
jgi:hypothetical protein